MSDNHTQADDDAERIKRTVSELMEHFDSVQIFATRHDPASADGTYTFQRGAGHWYMRESHVREWLVVQEERSRMKARKDMKEEEDDDDST